MNANEKLVRHRLSVIELAQELGSITKACQQRGMARSRFYDYKKRFETQGLEGLKDLPPIPKSHPQTTPLEVVERIQALALEHPAYGCNRLEALLLQEGVQLSSITIQKLLNEAGLGTRLERWLALEQAGQQQWAQLSTEQQGYLEQLNPQNKARHVESSAPGELLCQDVYFVGYFKGGGKVYAHTLVDTYSSLGFAFLHTSKESEAAAALLHNEVLPFYATHAVSVQSILTDNGREFCGSATSLETHPYEVYLLLNDIAHRKTKVRSPQTNGFVERFHRTLQEEFFGLALRKTLYESVEALQSDLDIWLHFYNYERSHLGYRNYGRKPIETFTAAVKPTAKRSKPSLQNVYFTPLSRQLKRKIKIESWAG